MKPEVLHKLRNLFPMHEAFYIHDAMVQCQLSAEATSTTQNFYLAILGLPGCGDHTYPLERISGTQWVYTGLIEIYFGCSQTESVTVAVTSDSLGDIGSLELRRADLSPRLVIRAMEGTTAKVQPVLSFTVLPFQPPKDETPTNQHTTILSKKILHIAHNAGDYASPIAYQKALETLQHASRTWTGLSVRKVTLNIAQLLFPEHSGASGMMESAVDTHLALLESAIGLSINTSSYEVKGDTEVLGVSVYIYAKLLHLRYTFHKDIEDIDRLINLQRLSLMLPHITPKAAITGLIQLLHEKSAKTSRPQLADFDETVDAARAAFNVDEDPTRIRSRCLVVRALIGRFEESGRAEDLEDGKTLLEDVMDFVPQDETLYGEMLALYARVLALLSGDDVAKINAAISSCHKALQYANDPADSQRRTEIHSTLFPLMTQLAFLGINSLEEDTLGTLDIGMSRINEMNSEIESATTYVQGFPKSAKAYIQAVQTGTLTASQLREHIARTRLEISNFSVSTPLHLEGTLWQLLVYLYQRLFEITEDRRDLDGAIDASRMVETIRSGRQDRGGGGRVDSFIGPSGYYTLGELGKLLVARHKLTKDPADIQEAVSLLRKCLESLPPGHQQGAAMTTQLGFALTMQGGQSIEEGLSLLSAAASLATAPPMDRLVAAQSLMFNICVIYGPEYSIEAFDMFMELLVTISNTKKSAGGRYEFLSEFSGDVLTAVLHAIQAERLDKALEWMEQGRGLVWSQLRNLRSPLDDLHVANPELAKRLEAVSQQLEGAEGHVSRFTQRPSVGELGQEQTVALHDDAARYFKLGKERQQILETIQNEVPGFGNFLRPKPCSVSMENLPDSGPVIVINVHKERCDALVLMRGHDEPLHIPLPDFSFQRAQQLQEMLRLTLVDYRLRTRGDEIGDPARGMRPSRAPLKDNPRRLPPIEFVLRELWICVVKIILDSLALFPSSDGPTTRIWWCPTGPLTFLPLHAAGIYRGDSPVALSDFAVSSYIPTVAVLSERVANPRNTPPECSGILLVSVPEGKGSRNIIPGTTLEVDKVHSLLTSSSIPSLQLGGENATVSDGLNEMEKHSCVHLACHAKQDASQPLESGFLFHDGQLDLSAIIKCNLKYADLAFLSACQTSTGHETLSEEAVHLAAGMLAAGYQGVVATMWSIPDRYAPKVAESFYADLLARGSGTEKSINGADAAYSIHQAVKDLRTEIGVSEAAMLAWVPYVHFGL